MSDVLGSVNGSTQGVVQLPTVRIVDNRYVIEWPYGRPQQFAITADLFEAMITEINDGKRAVFALARIADALRDVLPTPSPTA